MNLCKLESSLAYIARPCPKSKTSQQTLQKDKRAKEFTGSKEAKLKHERIAGTGAERLQGDGRDIPIRIQPQSLSTQSGAKR